MFIDTTHAYNQCNLKSLGYNYVDTSNYHITRMACDERVVGSREFVAKLE